MPSWRLTIRTCRRPWWTLGLLVHVDEAVLTRDGTEEEVLAGVAELKAEHPSADFRLERVAAQP